MAARMAQPSVVVPLELEEAAQQTALLDYATQQAGSGRLYLYLTGPAATAPPTPLTLDCLTHCFEPSAQLKPKQDVVPLLPFLGWTPERLASLAGVEEMIAAAEHADRYSELLDRMNAVRQQVQLPSLSLTLTAGSTQQSQDGRRAAVEGAAATRPAPNSRVLAGWEGPLQFSKVAVGGTFDRLHAGHRLLLAATAVVATRYIFVGVTADKLLASKRNRELLEPYEVRQAAAVDYMRAVNPGVQVIAGPLVDPKEPPVAATDPSFEAIVVSEETIPGALWINSVRSELGFQPLAVVVVGLIAPRRSSAKLSSTDLRAADAGE